MKSLYEHANIHDSSCDITFLIIILVIWASSFSLGGSLSLFQHGYRFNDLIDLSKTLL